MKKEKELESNIINDIFYELLPERKQRSEKSKDSAQESVKEIEEDEYFQDIRDKKKARYEALKRKAREGWGD